MFIHLSIITSFLLLLTFKVTAITYGVYNPHPESSGGARFEKEVGSAYTLEKLSAATDFIWQTFNQAKYPQERKPGISRITLHVVPWKGEVQTKGSQLYISSIYIKNYNGDIKREIARLIYHEMAHMFQWTGNGQAPKALIEGVADYVKIKAGYAEDQHKKNPGDGERWDQGFEITAYFLDYCTSLSAGFVAELNARMKDGFDIGYFKDKFGKPIERIWDDYKDKYSHKNH